MKKIVVDTSVLVKWLNHNDEPFVDHADALLRDAYERKVILFAPELAKYRDRKGIACRQEAIPDGVKDSSCASV